MKHQRNWAAGEANAEQGTPCDRLEARAKIVEPVLADEFECDPHEEAAGIAILELVRLDDVAAVLRQMAGHSRDDAGMIDARQRQDVGFTHGNCRLEGNVGDSPRSFCGGAKRCPRRKMPHPGQCQSRCGRSLSRWMGNSRVRYPVAA